jgi:hypothetical protein
MKMGGCPYESAHTPTTPPTGGELKRRDGLAWPTFEYQCAAARAAF